MALNILGTNPIIARKFGRTFERIEHLPDVCLKYQKLGKVGVSCQFKLSKSKWGVLGETENPGGVIYMSLGFDQPRDCKLSTATVSITLEEYETGDDRGRRLVNRPVSHSLRITDRYGPKQLFGKERLVSFKRNVHLTPNINVFGNGAGGVGVDTAKEVFLSSRWVFNGRLKPAAHPTQKGQHTSVYRTLEWELTESDFELHAAHTNMIHTGFAFEHDGKPFYMEVNVKGKLQSTRGNFLRSLKFSSEQNKSKGSASTFVHLPRGCHNSARLDSLADSLPRQMEMENLEEVPTEVPDALPGSVHVGGIAGCARGEALGVISSTAAPSSGSEQPSTIPNSTERVTLQSAPRDPRISSLALTDPTYPSVENLSKALLVFTGPSQEETRIATSEVLLKDKALIPSEPQDGSLSEEGSSYFQSDTTLVDEQDAEVQVDGTRLAKDEEIQDSLLLPSDSPYLLLFIQVLLWLRRFFLGILGRDSQVR
ncbi:hypothetical protein MFRU_024g00980 [Monilinia fructicola]|uniref:Uncharacterized protein n=1 Tax=Monilinia fructicola TaxID=38448 RepID=A0A5M9J4F2_MONFR|nr:hypothetical protein EYC84_011730 [Monilinia fructicola]KAG4028128.1 hypothetical protein MFRU_024g00980 [Monilinia fructicola]